MNRREELLALAGRVEGLTGPDREVDAEIAAKLRHHFGLPDWAARWGGEWRPTSHGHVVLMHEDGTDGPNFTSRFVTSSIDDAVWLVPERYKRHISMVISPASIDMGRRDYQAYLGGHARKGRARSFALALTAAALRALAEQQQ